MKKKNIEPKKVLIVETIILTFNCIALIFVAYSLFSIMDTSENIDSFGSLYLYLTTTTVIFIAGFWLFPFFIGESVNNIRKAYKKIK